MRAGGSSPAHGDRGHRAALRQPWGVSWCLFPWPARGTVRDASLSQVTLGAGAPSSHPGTPHDPPLSRQCLTEAPKTRRQAELMQSSNLIEITPRSEGRVYTRCFCLEEPLGAVSSRIPPASLPDPLPHPSRIPPASLPDPSRVPPASLPHSFLIPPGSPPASLPRPSQIPSHILPASLPHSSRVPPGSFPRPYRILPASIPGPSAARHRSPPQHGMLLAPWGGQRPAPAPGAWCC